MDRNPTVQRGRRYGAPSERAGLLPRGTGYDDDGGVYGGDGGGGGGCGGSRYDDNGGYGGGGFGGVGDLVQNDERKKKRRAWACKIFAFSCTSLVSLLIGAVAMAAFLILRRGACPPCHTPATLLLPPGAPTALLLASRSYTSLVVSWNQPDDHGSTISKYELQYARAITNSSHSNWTDASLPDRGMSLEATVGSLSANFTYALRVRAFNSRGAGAWSGMVSYATLPPAAPDEPSAPLAVGSNTTSLLLAWQPPAHDNGAEVTSFELQQSNSSADADFFTVASALATNSFDDSGLTIDTIYFFRVRASNRVGASAWSRVATCHTNAANASVPAVPKELRCQAETATELTLAWDQPDNGGAIILGYQLQLEGAVANQTVYTGISLSAAATNLTPASNYSFRVNAFNSIGSGDWSSAVSCGTLAAGVPGAPPPVILLQTWSQRLNVSWLPPISDGGASIGSYTLQHDNWFASTPLATAYEGPLLSYDTGFALVPAVQYNFRVQATNRVGSGPWSPIINFTTDSAPACGNTADVAVWRATWQSTLKSTVQSCIIGCIVEGESCAISCISAKLGFSADCARCWGDMGLCTSSKCALQCIVPTSQKCTDCAHTKCFPAAVACTGMPLSVFPP